MLRGVIVVHGRALVMRVVRVQRVCVVMGFVRFEGRIMDGVWMPQLAVAQGLAHGCKPLQRQRKGQHTNSQDPQGFHGIHRSRSLA